MKEKILIALSDSNLAPHLSDTLKSEGYTIIITENGDEAIKDMQLEMPDLAIIDLVLPGKSGYDVLTEKTLDRLITKIPVLVVSNYGSTVEIKKIPSTPSIKDYIIRAHIEPEEIVKKISGIFGHIYNPSKGNSPVSRPQSAHKKILWIEDDKFLRSILVKKFESSGHTVLKAENGEEAMSILTTETPDIIVIDILLPGINGFDILQKIKANEKLNNIPIIILSNINKPSDVEKAKTLGAQKFLVKSSVSLNEIILEIEQLTKV
jgi:DNA-binding response OmpR family regulator